MLILGKLQTEYMSIILIPALFLFVCFLGFVFFILCIHIYRQETDWDFCKAHILKNTCIQKKKSVLPKQMYGWQESTLKHAQHHSSLIKGNCKLKPQSVTTACLLERLNQNQKCYSNIKFWWWYAISGTLIYYKK